MDALLKVLSEHTKVTTYVLPLLGLNKFSFGDNNFVESYINQEGSLLCVEVKQANDTTLTIISQLNTTGICLGAPIQVWFIVPIKWQSDIELFKKGRYGDLSEEAKSMIRTYSGLPYRMPYPDQNALFTDYRLLALDRSDVLKDKWASIILDHDDPPLRNTDWMQPPTDRDYKEYINKTM